MIFIGVDPGKRGGFAVLGLGAPLVEVWSDDGFVEAMRNVHSSFESRIACVEKVGAMPGQGVTSMFSFGKSAGYIEGVLAALEIPFQLVPPRTWKKEFSLGSNKADSIEVCKRLFPTVSLRATERCRVDSDGMAEALLMAEWAKRLYGFRG